ncbi:MAG TPA: zinc ribbon domain-containing protein [Gemmatimonadetes bacterium]|nr:zinc ribbon domain-containing protein [Gemmatimonadota bacterium]
MPHYEYHCASNGQTLEVNHRMNERLETWGELVARAEVDVGATPADTPVDRLMSAPIPHGRSGGETDFQGCGSGCACVPQS